MRLDISLQVVKNIRCLMGSPELRNSLIADLEYLKHLYKLKRILND